MQSIFSENFLSRYMSDFMLSSVTDIHGVVSTLLILFFSVLDDLV